MVTAKEKVPSEDHAAAALRFLDQRQDPPAGRLNEAARGWESFPEEEATVQEARDEVAPGASLISHEEIKRRVRHRVQGLERPVVSGRFVLKALCAPGSDRLYARAYSTRAYARASPCFPQPHP